MERKCDGMKNLNVMYSSKTDQWETPQDFYEKLNMEFSFDLDPCADETNHKCALYFDKNKNGLLQDWGGIEFFATHPMVKILNYGFKNVMRKAERKTQWLLCSFLQELIQNIFTILYGKKLK